MACTTILVGKKASYDGSTMIARNDDSGSGSFTPKKFVVIHPSEQPTYYKSEISHVEIDLPEDPMRYTSMPNVLVAWPRVAVKNGLGEYLSSMGMTQLRIAETEKYAHVTFFFNGGVETQYPGEDRVLVPSPKVATYDLQPEMSAFEVCDKCVERIESGAYDVIILNFANCDMVGHTGVLQAAVKAVETVDTCVGRVVEATLKMGGIAMVTADHGNAEVMLQPDGSPMTAHTTNLVPFILCGAGNELRPGRLADIAPTILDVMGLATPQEMDGKTLIVK